MRLLPDRLRRWVPWIGIAVASTWLVFWWAPMVRRDNEASAQAEKVLRESKQAAAKVQQTLREMPGQ